MGGLEFHVWGALVADYEHPDELVFDLDPDVGLAWERVVAGARAGARAAGAARAYAASSRRRVARGCTWSSRSGRRRSWDEVKAFCRALANHIVGERPLEYTATMSKAKREGRIFIDYLRNGRGATSVVAYSSRRRAGAPVSMPLRWDELSGLTERRLLHRAQRAAPAVIAQGRSLGRVRGCCRSVPALVGLGWALRQVRL